MNGDLREIIQHGMKRCGMGTPDLRKSVEQGHEALVEVCEDLVKSLWGGGDLKYIGHCLCVRKDSNMSRKAIEREVSSDLVERKAGVGGRERCQLEKVMRSGAGLTDAPHQLNGTELSQEEF